MIDDNEMPDRSTSLSGAAGERGQNSGPDLVAFIRARLDEDERIAQAASDPKHPGEWVWRKDSRTTVRTTDGVPIEPAETSIERGPHIAQWHPARVLREVEVKLAIVDLHIRVWIHPGAEDFNDAHLTKEPMAICRSCSPEKMWRRERSWPCRTLLALALPYANHSSYQDAWRP